MLLKKGLIVKKMLKNKKLNSLIILHIMLFIYSFCGVFSKIAGGSEFLSNKFFICYGVSLFILFIYTVAWQQILKKIPLIIAFLNKSITIIWSMIWGLIIFKEKITFTMILGSIIVLIGVSLVVKSDE